MLIVWLLTCLALTIERLYRLRYLPRGTHALRAAITLWQLFWLSLSAPVPPTIAVDPWLSPRLAPQQLRGPSASPGNRCSKMPPTSAESSQKRRNRTPSASHHIVSIRIPKSLGTLSLAP